MEPINHRCEKDGKDDFVKKLDDSYRNNLQKTPVAKPVKRDKQDQKTVNKLRNYRRACCPEPQLTLTGDFLNLMKRMHINDLANQKGRDRTHNNSHSLPENGVVSIINVEWSAGNISAVDLSRSRQPGVVSRQK